MPNPLILSSKALNRALLARQMLITRENVSVVAAVEKLVGLQAQQARPPFVGLWTRLEGFERELLNQAFTSRAVVRATMWRGTLHVVSAGDYLAFRTSLQPLLTGASESILAGRTDGFDKEKVIALAFRYFMERPHTFTEIREVLIDAFPEGDERAMGFISRNCVPLVMLPDTSECSFTGSTFLAARAWFGRDPDPEDRMEELVLRYLAAFGPASIRDAKAWSGLTKLEAVFEKLRPRLATFRDEHKRELFDLPDAPRPAEQTPVPVRFLPGFDNLTLAHADRTRVLADEYRKRISTKNLQIFPTFLVDGSVAGVWEIESKRKVATLTISPFIKLSRAIKNELEEEALKLGTFMAPEVTQLDVVLEKES